MSSNHAHAGGFGTPVTWRQKQAGNNAAISALQVSMDLRSTLPIADRFSRLLPVEQTYENDQRLLWIPSRATATVKSKIDRDLFNNLPQMLEKIQKRRYSSLSHGRRFGTLAKARADLARHIGIFTRGRSGYSAINQRTPCGMSRALQQPRDGLLESEFIRQPVNNWNRRSCHLKFNEQKKPGFVDACRTTF